MSEEQQDDFAAWLVSPVAPDETRVYFAAGDDVELSDEVRDALETLLDEINDAEVEGFAFGAVSCSMLDACSAFSCSPMNKCTVLTKAPCFSDLSCVIAKLRF